MTRLAGVPVPATGFDPTSEDVQRDPYPHYLWLLRNDPVHRGANGIWYVSRYADVRTVMADRRFGRAGIREFWAEMVGPGPLSEILRHTIFFQDPPDHDRLRTLIAPAFAPRVVRALEPRIGQIVDELIDAVAPDGEMEAIGDFAYPLALTVIAHVLGLPAEDRAQLRAWSVAIAPTLDLAATPQEIVRGQEAMGQFVDYLTDLVSGRRGRLGEGLLATMLEAGGNGRGGTRPAASMAEVLSTGVTLVFAGHDTVTSLIGNGLLALLRHPDQLELLRREPGLLPGAVEEFLRYDSSVQSNYRQVGEDVELGGKTMRRGELVVVLAGAANRDPRQFADPDRFDVTRTDVQPMSFGSGMRFCLGAVLARLEAVAAFARLIALDDLRLAVPEDDLVYRRSTMFRGLAQLPVSFTPSSPAARRARR